MSGLNKVMLIGRLGKDPEVKNIKGLDICNFSLATSKSWNNEAGEKQEDTQWHQVVAFKKLAEICGKYLKKGKQVYIEGEIKNSSWEDNGVKKYKTEIIAQSAQFLGDKDNSDAGQSTDEKESKVNNEEIPF